MKLGRLGFLALGAVPAIDAYRDTSPFFLFSTHKFETPPSRQIQSAPSVAEDVLNGLAACPSRYYILVSQPEVHASDYVTKWSAPLVRASVLKKDGDIASSFAVSEVVGEVDLGSIQTTLQSKCEAGDVLELDGTGTYTAQGENQNATIDWYATDVIPSMASHESERLIVRITFPPLSTGANRSEMLAAYDAYLGVVISRLPKQDYTVIYATTPRQGVSALYETDTKSDHDAVHVQHRRNSARDDTPDKPDSKRKPLFETYQFFSPGIFMGLMVGILFLLILYFGISALSSLQVSYAAFTKENGPGSTKKQQ